MTRPNGPARAATAAATESERETAVHWPDGLRYGLLGAPLAFAALPLFVQLPDHYAGVHGAALAGLGLTVLLVRLLDAGLDPWLGRLADRLMTGRCGAAGASAGDAAGAQRHSPMARVGWVMAVAAVLLAGGLYALFAPPDWQGNALLAWCAVALAVTGLGHSTLAVAHQAWATRLGGAPVAQARWAGWREAMALVGVLTASVLPTVAGVQALAPTAAALLLIGLLALSRAPRPQTAAGTPHHGADPWLPWRQMAFRRLAAVQVLSGVAAAVPATLVLFFVRDRLQAPEWAGALLLAYFLAAGAAVPLWTRIARRLGLVRTWLLAMVLACTAFVWAAGLGAGDVVAFLLVCVISGTALGADLVVPAALLTGVVQRAGHDRAHEGRYVGWWSALTKLNLALAAGLALPLLDLAGYTPGTRSPQALTALALAYAGLPCAIKLLAAAAVWRWRAHWETPALRRPELAPKEAACP